VALLQREVRQRLGPLGPGVPRHVLQYCSAGLLPHDILLVSSSRNTELVVHLLTEPFYDDSHPAYGRLAQRNELYLLSADEVSFAAPPAASMKAVSRAVPMMAMSAESAEAEGGTGS
jgi:hypothetical protein